MRIIRQIEELEDIKKGCVLTIGNFDGVHIGHQAILSAAKRIAEQRQTEIIVMTFQPHPLSILNPQNAPGTLTPFPLKEHLLAKLGVGTLFEAKSEPEILGLTAEDFAERFILKGIRPSAIVEGEDFNFGNKRTGSVHTLQKLAGAKGIEVVVVEAEKAELPDGRTVEVSSTVIREMISKGKATEAVILLGRPYRLIGNIIPGRGKGKQLGFPTLNLKKPEQIIPAEGVYAGMVEIGESEEQVCLAKEKIPAVFSIGRTTTYGANQSLLIEAHLLVENAERFSGRWMAMDFIERIRSQQKFETEKDLAEQIDRDCRKTQQILRNLIMKL
ncbi:MAG: riboflavin biosynthesis protein RibF [Sedimentisphaerales bacterium]|nr:riboflavin biosynthesis protein RibF [Sedimentisphaerales bacterium]